MNIITRFPPSPTGFIHIGNVRTALFNWLYAKATGGKMVLRIEDTDRARYKDEYVDSIFNALTWLGLDYDGEPFYQSKNIDRHKAVVQELLDCGKAYRCYCTPEELEAMREQAQKDGAKVFYDRRWRDRDPKDAPGDVDPVIRIKAPLEGSITIHDEVQGEVTVNADQLDDFIIQRSDGTPTYMLAVVVDDFDMGVSHVIRGDDHLNNTFRQLCVVDAMGWHRPKYAHLPMILGPDGGKLSKRHGSTSIEEFQAAGYLPEAVFNYLLRLGWSHGDDEIISKAQAIEWFKLEDINKSAGKFDYTKLESLNAHYIKEADNQRLLLLIAPLFQSRHDVSGVDEDLLLRALDLFKPRAKTLNELADQMAFLVKDVQPDEKAQAALAEDSAPAVLKAVAGGLAAMDDLTKEAIDTLLKDLADTVVDGKFKFVGMPLRAALTGTTNAPGVPELMLVMGKDAVLQRLTQR